METLATMKCPACHPGAPKVTEEQIAKFMPQLTGWKIIEIDGIKRLQRRFKFVNFAEALAFTNAVGQLAEKEAHHPAILTEWGRVIVTWWTHAIDGLHKSDFIMAAKTDLLYVE
jgi:4a-hydroxytetrahydrobiopterin dehydratase